MKYRVSAFKFAGDSTLIICLVQAPLGHLEERPDNEGFIMGYQSYKNLQLMNLDAAIDPTSKRLIEDAAYLADKTPNYFSIAEDLIDLAPKQLEILGFVGAAKLARLSGEI